MRVFECSASAGRIKVDVSGEGNGTTYTFRLLDGQFPAASVKRLAQGVELTIVGEWEAAEFHEVLAQVIGGKEAAGNWTVEVSEADQSAGFVMPFGKHKGKSLADCPEDYLRWIAENLTDKKIREHAQALLGRPGKKAPLPGDAFLDRR